MNKYLPNKFGRQTNLSTNYSRQCSGLGVIFKGISMFCFVQIAFIAFVFYILN